MEMVGFDSIPSTSHEGGWEMGIDGYFIYNACATLICEYVSWNGRT